MHTLLRPNSPPPLPDPLGWPAHSHAILPAYAATQGRSSGVHGDAPAALQQPQAVFPA